MTLFVSACASHQTNYLPIGIAPSSIRGGAARQGIHDLGQRAPSKPVSIVLLLRYRNQQGLDAFMRQLAKASRPRYLTRSDFLSRYAPTTAQESQVVASLQRAGFSITKRYANRTIIDASAPSRTVERFFGTTIHDFSQQGQNVAYASIKAIVMPKQLSALIAAVNIDTVVHLHAGFQDTPSPILERTAPVGSSDNIVPDEPHTSTGNVVENPGFETGHLKPWYGCHNGSAPIGKVTDRPHTGNYSAFAGTYTTAKPEINGVSCVEQLVTIPKSGKISVWVYRTTNDTSNKAGQYGALYANTAKGNLLKTLFNTLTTSGWQKVTSNVSSLAGRQVWLTLGVYGSRKDVHKYVGMWIDDVSLVGTASPTPTPSPTAMPTGDPGCYNGATPPPTPVPNYGADGGWGPNAVADGLLMGSIDCYYGSGQTAAVVLYATPASSDIAAYLAYFGITRTGTITNEAVDGGSGAGNADWKGEATLDVETIASLATGANVIVYDMPLSQGDQAVEDAYNQILSDGKATVVNSSLASCEADDPSFNTVTNSIAEQGAAEGVTFSAAPGDGGVNCAWTTPSHPVFGVGSPASDPYFVGVGGSQSTSNPAASDCSTTATDIYNPVVWNDCVGAGNGGISTVWPLPSYQSGLTSVSGRSVPDISLPAAGVDIVLNDKWQTYWGTSWASPIYVAMQAEVNDECGTNYWGINSLYGALAKDPTYQYAFYDVTSGNDSYNGLTGYRATTGFDTASGIGIPLGVNIAYYACGTSSSRHALRAKNLR